MSTDILKRLALTLFLVAGIGAAGTGAANAHGHDEHRWQGNMHAPAHGHWKHNHGGHCRWEHGHDRQRWTGRYHRSRHADHQRWRHEHHVSHVQGGLNIGTLLGGVAGGVIGNQFGSGRGKVLATVGGALIGGIVGDSIYRDIRARDEANLNSALETAPSGTATSWNNPDSGNTGQITPTRTFADQQGRNCREFQHVVTIGGNTETVVGTACRQPDGTWRVVE